MMQKVLLYVYAARPFVRYVTQCLFNHSKRHPDNFFRTHTARELVPHDCRIATDLLAYMEHTQVQKCKY
jgi:hypothetical protein